MPHRRARGHRAGLSLAAVIDEALALVDRDGLAALSMRKLGATLGVEAMTLYHYFPSKDALLDSVVERVLTQALTAIPEAASWQALLRQYAHSLRRIALQHPAILPLALTRPAASPEALAVVERGLATLIRAGFRLTQALDVLNSLTVFVLGHTTAEISAGNKSGSSGATRQTGVDRRNFPLIAQAARTGRGADDEERFRFGTEALIAGFAPLVPR